MDINELIIRLNAGASIGVILGLFPLYFGYRYHIKDLAWFGLLLCIGTGILFGGYVSGIFALIMTVIIYLEYKKKSNK